MKAKRKSTKEVKERTGHDLSVNSMHIGEVEHEKEEKLLNFG